METAGAKVGEPWDCADGECCPGLADGPRTTPPAAWLETGWACEAGGVECCRFTSLGLVEDDALAAMAVELLETGEGPLEVKVSTSSMVRDCQPLWTLSMA